jgi:hypothetical protein
MCKRCTRELEAQADKIVSDMVGGGGWRWPDRR